MRLGGSFGAVRIGGAEITLELDGLRGLMFV